MTDHDSNDAASHDDTSASAGDDLAHDAAGEADGRREPTWQDDPAKQDGGNDAEGRATTPEVPPNAPGPGAASENLARSKSNWWLPDGYHVFFADWQENDWVRFLGFGDFRDAQYFALRGMDVLGRSSETHSLSPLQQVQLAMSVPYVRTNVFAREEPGRAKDWVQRGFEMYATEFSVARPKPQEVLKLPEELQGALAWQVSPVMRKLRGLSDQAAGILKHALRTLKTADKLSELQQSVLGLGFLVLTDLFCAPELLWHAMQASDAMTQGFPRMRELAAHIQAYRRNMPVSLQVMLGTSAVLAEEFAGDLREFSETGSDPAMCYDRLRDVKALVDVAVDLTQFALPDLIARTLQEHVEQPARQLLREGVSQTVRHAAARLFAGSHAILESVRDGKRVGNLLEHPWKLWADQMLKAMRETIKAQDGLEKMVLEKAKDPVKNLKALQDLARQVDAFEQSPPCLALQALFDQEPSALHGAARAAHGVAPVTDSPSADTHESTPESMLGASDPVGPSQSGHSAAAERAASIADAAASVGEPASPDASAMSPDASSSSAVPEMAPTDTPPQTVFAPDGREHHKHRPRDDRPPRPDQDPPRSQEPRPQGARGDRDRQERPPEAGRGETRAGTGPENGPGDGPGGKPIPRREDSAEREDSRQQGPGPEGDQGASEVSQAPRERHPRPNKPRPQHPPGQDPDGSASSQQPRGKLEGPAGS